MGLAPRISRDNVCCPKGICGMEPFISKTTFVPRCSEEFVIGSTQAKASEESLNFVFCQNIRSPSHPSSAKINKRTPKLWFRESSLELRIYLPLGTQICCPTCRASGSRPGLASRISSTVVPSSRAMEYKVSPARMVRGTYPVGHSGPGTQIRWPTLRELGSTPGLASSNALTVVPVPGRCDTGCHRSGWCTASSLQDTGALDRGLLPEHRFSGLLSGHWDRYQG